MAEQGNIYARTREQAMKDHAERLSGNSAGIVLVLFTEPIAAVAESALEKGFAALGFGEDACTFAQVKDLAETDLFNLVEGIDPLLLVVTDADAAKLYAGVVRQPLPLLGKARLFGRETRAFPHLNSMFETEADRQTVWRLLKSMV